MAYSQIETHAESNVHFSRIINGMVDDQNNQITMSRTEFENLLKSYSDVVLTNKILLNALREAVPELEEHFYENGIDKKEMEKLLNNRQQIFSQLREL